MTCVASRTMTSGGRSASLDGLVLVALFDVGFVSFALFYVLS